MSILDAQLGDHKLGLGFKRTLTTLSPLIVLPPNSYVNTYPQHRTFNLTEHVVFGGTGVVHRGGG